METIEEVIEKYGNIFVTFSSYYKYSFSFGADIEDGIHIGLSVGGNADDIYRLSIDNNPITIKQIYDSMGISFIYAKQNDKELFSISDY